MKYIIFGILVSIGWHTVKLIYEMVYELLFNRLHKADWYRIVAGEKPKDKRVDAKAVKNQIGFCYTEKIES